MWVYCMHKRTGSRHVSRHTHTHTADETFTALIPKYYQDFQLLSLTPSLTSLPVSPSTPPLLHLMCLKKETAHSILQRDWERNIYKNISPAARIDLADLLGSRPPSFHLLLCRSLQLCPQTRTNNLPAILDPQFFVFFCFFALPPTLFCPGSQSQLSTSSQALSFILLNNWANLAVWENIRQSVTAWRMWTWCSRRYVKCNPLLTFISHPQCHKSAVGNTETTRAYRYTSLKCKDIWCRNSAVLSHPAVLVIGRRHIFMSIIIHILEWYSHRQHKAASIEKKKNKTRHIDLLLNVTIHETPLQPWELNSHVSNANQLISSVSSNQVSSLPLSRTAIVLILPRLHSWGEPCAAGKMFHLFKNIFKSRVWHERRQEFCQWVLAPSQRLSLWVIKAELLGSIES